MNKLIDKYILKKFILNLVIALSSFIIIFIIVNIIDFLDKFIERGISSKEILLYYYFTIPYFISIALPMSILISTIFTFGTLQKNNEITAIKASGISIRRAGISILISGIIFCFLSFFFENIIVVNSIQKRQEIERKLKPLDKRYIKNRKNDIFYHLDDSFLGIKRFNYKNDTGYNVTIQKYNGSDIIYRLDAKKISWNKDIKSWDFEDCHIRDWNNNKLKYYSIKDTNIIITDVYPEIIKRDFIKPEEMDYWELSAFIKKLQNKGLDYSRWLVNKHYKTAFACIPFIMVIFGLALSIQKPRSSYAIGMGLSIIVIFLYYASIIFGKTLGYNNTLSPFLSVWIVNIIFLLLGCILYFKART